MNEPYLHVGRSLTSYTLDQLCDSSSQLSRGRTHGLRSMHSVHAPHVDTPNPIRRAATLEGRTRYICITPSRTRESWLKRARSPSVSSGTSNQTESRVVNAASRVPNSHSDGSLMKRLSRVAEPSTKVRTPVAYRLHKTISLSTTATPSDYQNGVSRSTSNDLHDASFLNRTAHLNTAYKASENVSLQNKTQESGALLTRPIARPAIPNLRKQPEQTILKDPSQPSTRQSRVRLSKSIQFEPTSTSETDAKCLHEQIQANSCDHKLIETRPVSLQSTKPVTATNTTTTKDVNNETSHKSSSKPTREIRKPKLMFTRALLDEAAMSPMIKPNGKVCEYPLHSWFATVEHPSYDILQDESKTTSLSYPFPPETSDGLDNFISDEPQTCPARRKWPAQPQPARLKASLESEPTKLNHLSETTNVLIPNHHQQQPDAQPLSATAPLAQAESDYEPRSGAQLTEETEERREMHRFSAENDSSTSDRLAGTLSTKQPQTIPAGREKPKIADLRRTTPRQIKQHQHKQIPADAKVSNLLTNVNDKSGKTGPLSPDPLTKTDPGEIALTLLRTASLHLRSTWSKLKRSNSGHSTKSQSNSSASLRERRCSDPSRGLLFENEELEQSKQANHHQPDPVSDPSKIKTSIITVPPRASSLKNPPINSGLTSTNAAHPRPRVVSAPDDSPPPPPGCSKWSTRLDPPPPVSNGRPIQHTYGPVVFKPVQRNRSTDLSPDNEKPVVSRLEWKPQQSHGLGATFSSLPTGDSDDLNLLTDDCVDVGELGRINFRTGSFMGRYPQPRGQHIRCPPFPTGPCAPNRHVQNPISTTTTTNTTNNTPSSRMSPSRPLYLSPAGYSAQTSGNTTRSAPSPSLSSMTSTSGPVGTQDVGKQSKSGLATSRYTTSPTGTKLHVPTTSVSSLTVTTESGGGGGGGCGQATTTSFLELDPVLARLLSDVSSLDEYRSALRPQAVQLRTQSMKPIRAIPAALHHDLDENRFHLTATENASPFGSSDPGSIALSQEFPSRRALTRQLSEDHYNLRQEINDLIQLEFSYPSQRGSPARTIGTRTQALETDELRATSRLSEPNVSEDLPLNVDDGGFGSRTRYHPFRWSSGGHGSKSTSKQYRDGTSHGQTQPRILVHPPKSSSTLVLEAAGGSMDQISQSDKRVRIRPDPATDISADLHLSGSFWDGDTATGDRVSIWLLTTGQLALLRKLGLVQLTSVAEKHCVNRSPFNWRFLKYRTGTSPGDAGIPAVNPSQASHKPVDIQVSEPAPPQSGWSTDVSTDRINCSSANTVNMHSPPSSSAVASQCTISPNDLSNSSHTPRWTGYDGPVFGQSLVSWQRRLGYPLPSAIVHMMDHLERIGATAHGIFRRPGGKVRTQALREEIERNLDWKNFDDWQPYDVADLLKQFFRELPECLLTSKLSTVLVNVYSNIPASSQMDLLRWVLIGLPDENRVVLQKLLYLLNSLVRFAHVTQMSASNLAVCFAPSLFRLISASSTSQTNVGLSPRRLRRTTSGPDPKDLADQRTAQLSLSTMITHAPALFEISINILRRAHLIPNPFEPRDLESIIPAGDWPTWIQAEISRLSRECSNTRSKGWSVLSREAWKAYQTGSGAGESLEGLEVHYKKPSNPSDTKAGPPLRTWRCSLPILEPDPKEILDRFWYQRASWDPEVGHIQVVDQISDCVDLCLINYTSTFPQLPCEVHVVRGRQCLLEDGAATLFCESISPTLATASDNPAIAIGHIYEDHVYVRPLADKSGCRVYLLSRVDLKGHSPDWYVNHWGHTLVRRLLNLRRSFQT